MKKKNTRLVSVILLSLLLLSGVTGCGNQTEGNTMTSNETAATIAPTKTEVTATSAPTASPDAESASTDTAADSSVPDTGFDLTAVELTKLMGNGINLGNTMEAWGHSGLGINAAVSSYETYWGQPVTTQEIIDSMKAAGFDTLRIPVAWTNTMDFENGDYTIRQDYLDRVGEIIQYALNADMYVIVNDHWDGGWWGRFGSATEEIRTAAMDQYVAMWTQIANEYKDFSSKLIFESANEELGSRLNDTDFAADSGSLSESECYEVMNQINQTFVDLIRSTGGNNEKRFLLIAGYNTDIAKTNDSRFVMPTDTQENKLLVSVHYYTPWGYCGNESLATWGSVANYDEQNSLLSSMASFVDQGYGVVIGEYAVSLASDGTAKENTTDFFTNFLDNCDYYNYCPMLWDCSSLFIRRDLGFFDADVASLFLNRSYSAQSNYTSEEVTANAKTSMDLSYENAVAADVPFVLPDDQAMAWIMFNSGDWGIMYSVGDVYDPTAKTGGLVTTDVEITGEGTYTVALDFTGTGNGTANSVAFSALAIANGETLFPGYIVDIKEILVNGEPYTFTGKPYTTSDDQICTRVNLFNDWVGTPSSGVRTIDGTLDNVSAKLLDKATLGLVKTLEITFTYAPAQ